MGAASLPVICFAGPTGSGKTAIALMLAERLDGEVINADSRQVYADFPLICAQPTPEEQGRVPHHLYGFLPTDRKISAGQWGGLAAERVRQVLGRGRTPLLVGGTGMYFHALLHGIADIPPVDPAVSASLEARVDAEGAPALHAELVLHDPAYAVRIHPNDRQRIVRALEVFQGTGRPFSWWHENAMAVPLCKGPLLVLDARLPWLEPRLARRMDEMLAGGAMDEARRALSRCGDGRAPGWSGIGCAEAFAFLKGSIDAAECRRLWLHNTRMYAKRQITWFRGRKEAVFLPPQDAGAVLDAARRLRPGRLTEQAPSSRSQKKRPFTKTEEKEASCSIFSRT